MDSKAIQRIYIAIESLLNKINEDLEVYSLKVSDIGSYNIHLIGEIYTVRIIQEVRRIAEHAPLITFNKSKKL